ncbi:uncharacterized protein LOC129568481 [Sitodiplosis mosellana]|uniref:uncharacterized protein LOC129568481 n=1 Tax=Sitodiplosis mosellana TaxID=263140 RepID=UPI002444969C|nr:uncharacterized protein LOC129568481 [Sitodiplosis mosellana]
MNVKDPDQSNTEWEKCVRHVVDKFQRETAATFMQFCRKCVQSGFSIDGDAFIKLIMDSLGQTFDRFHANFEMDKDQGGNETLNENYEKELAEFTEAAKKLIKEKMVPKEMQNSKKMKNKQQIIDLLQRCTSDVFGKDGGGKPVIDVNVTNIKNDNNDDESSLVVSVEMSSKSASCTKTGPTKLSRRAAKKCAKKSQMTITAVLEQSPAGMSQQVTITKDKSGSLSISGVSMKKSDKTPMDNGSSTKVKSAQNRNTTENSSKMMTEECQPKNSEQITETIKYRCAHCHDVNHWIESFNAPKDVYSHWLSYHTEPAKPFQYFVIEYAACYHCNGKTIATYHELIKHHKECHRAEPFVIVNQNDYKKCALCPYYGSGIIAHFHTMHRVVLKTLSLRKLRSFYTPHQLGGTVLEKHLESKVHKKQKCGNCNIVYETERDLRDHHSKCHKTTKMTVKEFYDNHSHLVCGVCHLKVDRNLYLGHIENHVFNFKCHRCDFTTIDMIELVKHDNTHGLIDSFEYRCIQFKNRLKRDYLKTLVVFGNGLMLTKRNMLNTKYDDSKQFDSFIDSLLKIKKERHSQRDLK